MKIEDIVGKTTINSKKLFVYYDVEVPYINGYSARSEVDVGNGKILIDGFLYPKAWVFYDEVKAYKFLKKVLNQRIEASIGAVITASSLLSNLRNALSLADLRFRKSELPF